MGEHTFNEWWLGLSEGQQKAWMEDKWMLADIAFRNGLEIGKNKPLLKNMLQEIWHDGCVNGGDPEKNISAIAEKYGYKIV